MRKAGWLLAVLGALAGLVLAVSSGERRPAPPRPARAPAPAAASFGPGDAPVAPPPPVQTPAEVPGPSPEQAREDAERFLVTFDAPTDCALSGVVRDEDGHPVAGAGLELHRRVDGARAGSTMTDAHGHYQLEGLTGFSHTLFVNASGHMDREFASPPLTPGPNTFDLTLRRAERVGGAVVDEAGRPVEGASVSLAVEEERTGRGEGFVFSDAEGHFQLDAPAPGRYRVHAMHPDFLFTEESVPVTAPVEGVRLVLRSGLDLEVEVVDAAGRPVFEAQVSARPSGDPLAPLSESFPTNDAGRVTLKGLEPGAYQVVAVQALPGHHRLAMGRTEPGRGGGAPAVRLRFEAGVSLSGRVVDGAGQPVEGVALLLAPAALGEPWREEGAREELPRDELKDAVMLSTGTVLPSVPLRAINTKGAAIKSVSSQSAQDPQVM